jgi:hypothetical protein
MKGTDKTTTITVIIIIAIICAMCLIPILTHKNYINLKPDKNNPLENSEMVDSITINNDSTGLTIIGLDNYNKCEYESHNMYMISESEEPVYMHISDSCKLCKADTINKIPDVTFIRVKWQFKNK